MKEKKAISLKAKYYIGSVVCGACWFFAGLFCNWDLLWCQIITIIALVGAAASMIIADFIQLEDGDEMSEKHFLKTNARIHEMILLTFLVFVLIGTGSKMLGKGDILNNWKSWLLMFIGCMQVIAGFLFARFERNGD